MEIVKKLTTCKGNNCIAYIGFNYRRPRVRIKQNSITWCCCNKHCNGTLITNASLEILLRKENTGILRTRKRSNQLLCQVYTSSYFQFIYLQVESKCLLFSLYWSKSHNQFMSKCFVLHVMQCSKTAVFGILRCQTYHRHYCSIIFFNIMYIIFN